jgi:hypothetical protein
MRRFAFEGGTAAADFTPLPPVAWAALPPLPEMRLAVLEGVFEAEEGREVVRMEETAEATGAECILVSADPFAACAGGGDASHLTWSDDSCDSFSCVRSISPVPPPKLAGLDMVSESAALEGAEGDSEIAEGRSREGFRVKPVVMQVLERLCARDDANVSVDDDDVPAVPLCGTSIPAAAYALAITSLLGLHLPVAFVTACIRALHFTGFITTDVNPRESEASEAVWRAWRGVWERRRRNAGRAGKLEEEEDVDEDDEVDAGVLGEEMTGDTMFFIISADPSLLVWMIAGGGSGAKIASPRAVISGGCTWWGRFWGVDEEEEMPVLSSVKERRRAGVEGVLSAVVQVDGLPPTAIWSCTCGSCCSCTCSERRGATWCGGRPEKPTVEAGARPKLLFRPWIVDAALVVPVAWMDSPFAFCCSTSAIWNAEYGANDSSSMVSRMRIRSYGAAAEEEVVLLSVTTS